MHNIGRDNVHGDRREQAASNQRVFSDVKWTDSPHGWWRCLEGRSEHSRRESAKRFLLFARAYVVAVESGLDNTTDAGLRETCEQIKARLDGSRDADGFVRVDAVIASFSMCSRLLFRDTMCLLRWAGHALCAGSLKRYHASMIVVTDAYWSHAQNSTRSSDAEVRPGSCHARLLNDGGAFPSGQWALLHVLGAGASRSWCSARAPTSMRYACRRRRRLATCFACSKAR